MQNTETNKLVTDAPGSRAESIVVGQNSGVEFEREFLKSLRFWHERAIRFGDGYVGRVNESWQQQQKNIEKHLKAKLGNEHYMDVLDFGCGWGRLIPFLCNYSGHIWAADIVETAIQRAGEMAPNVTAVAIPKTGNIELPTSSIDLVVVVSVFHFFKEDCLFNVFTKELSRVVKPGGRVIVIDNAVDKDYHVKPRSDKEIAASLCLREGWSSDKVTINRRQLDHWLIDGQRD